LLSVISIPSWFAGLPITSTEVFVGVGALLFVSGLMIGVGRKQRVALQRSLLTDEMLIYFSRIADAVERQADRPTVQQIAEMIERRIAEYQRTTEAAAAASTVAAGAGTAPKSRAMPLSMFGREYPEKS
jgi:hypothetical protein